MLILTNQHHFLITYFWDALNVNANQTKFYLSNIKLPGWEKTHAKTVAWSYDMEGHAQKCVERYFGLANKKTEQVYKVSSPCLDDQHFKEEDLLRFSITSTWDVLNADVNQSKVWLTNTGKYSICESSAEHLKSELANKKVDQLFKVSCPCLDDHQFQQKKLESV